MAVYYGLMSKIRTLVQKDESGQLGGTAEPGPWVLRRWKLANAGDLRAEDLVVDSNDSIGRSQKLVTPLDPTRPAEVFLRATLQLQASAADISFARVSIEEVSPDGSTSQRVEGTEMQITNGPAVLATAVLRHVVPPGYRLKVTYNATRATVAIGDLNERAR